MTSSRAKSLGSLKTPLALRRLTWTSSCVLGSKPAPSLTEALKVGSRSTSWYSRTVSAVMTVKKQASQNRNRRNRLGEVTTVTSRR